MMLVGRRGVLRVDHRLENVNRRNDAVEDRCSIHRDHERAHRDPREDEDRSLRHEDA